MTLHLVNTGITKQTTVYAHRMTVIDRHDDVDEDPNASTSSRSWLRPCDNATNVALAGLKFVALAGLEVLIEHVVRLRLLAVVLDDDTRAADDLARAALLVDLT